jgi:uncharacterized protein (DUF58 family)
MTDLAGQLDQVHAEARRAAELLRLPLRAGHREAGGLVSAGAGSSLDFRDHRPYVPGDDLRYLNWQAYGRTGQWILKVFHQESSPAVDLVLDASASMTFDSAKAMRAAGLLFFCMESALRASAALRIFSWKGGALEPQQTEALMAHELPFSDEAPQDDRPAPELHTVPWRHRSIRVLLSDLLFPAPGRDWFFPMGSASGVALCLAPFCTGESEPAWEGQLEFVDCETRGRREQYVDDRLLRRYRETYARHFAWWDETARRAGVRLARLESEPPLVDALRAGALASGAVEVRA